MKRMKEKDQLPRQRRRRQRKTTLLMPVYRLAEPEAQRRLEREGLEALALRKMKCTSLDCVSRVVSEEMNLGKAFRQTIGGTAVRMLTVARSRGDNTVDAASSTAMVSEETVPAASHAQRGHAGKTSPTVLKWIFDLHRTLDGSFPCPLTGERHDWELRDLNEVLRQPDPAVDDPTT